MNYYANLLFLQQADVANTILLSDVAGNRDLFVLTVAIIMVFLPFNSRVYRYSVELTENYATAYKDITRLVAAGVLFIVSVSSLLNSGFHPFIYFRF